MKRTLFLGVSLAVLMAGLAQAEEAAPRDEASVTAVVVTGERRANQGAIESKRKAVNITDVVSATEVRALPDNTVVDALRRIPGLSVVPAADHEHPRDEATSAVLRGLGAPYNNVTIDGLNVASIGGLAAPTNSITRGLRLDILPSSMVSEISVVKTFTPDLDPNAIGGAINLKTRSAFQGDGRPFLAAEASLGHASDVGKPTRQKDPGYRLIGTASTTFGPNGMFGAVLTANYQQLSNYAVTHMPEDSILYNFYDSAGKLQSGNNLGNGYAVPKLEKNWIVQNDRTRYGLTGKLEARPNENLYLYALGGYYFFREDFVRQEQLLSARPVDQNVLNQTATSGAYASGSAEVGYDNQVTTTRTRVAQLGADWTPAERHKLSVRGSYSRVTLDEPWYMIKYISLAGRPAPGTAGGTVLPNPALAFTYDTSNFNHVFSPNPAAYYNLSDYKLFYWRPDMGRNTGDKIWTGRLDYGFNQDAADQGLGWGVGAAYADDRSFYDFHRVELDPNTTAPALSLADVVGPSFPMPHNSLNILTIDGDRAKAILNSLPASMFNRPDQTAANNQDDFTHGERIGGAYAVASYRSDRLAAQAGVRYDRTEQSTTSRVRVATGPYADLTTSSTYAKLLPSALGTVHVTDSVDLRLAYSRTLGRPPYDAYAARTTINFQNAGDVGNPDAVGVSGTIGNPGIKPRVSDNLDLSAEWRIPGQMASLVSVAIFNKKIKDEIFAVASLGLTDPSSGVFYKNGVATTSVNASSARVRGIEGNLIINSFGAVAPVLRNIGVSTNVALMDGRITVPVTATTSRSIDRLVGQPSYTANATLFYSTPDLELRAAFNRQGRALRMVVANVAWQDLYWAPRSQLDLSASYRVRPGLSVIGQISNVTGSPATSLSGPGKNLLKDQWSVPTTFWLGVRFTPQPR